ncbi:GIY-YIG nuclease family protein [Streptomyces sp. NPDC012616]|uniref:GIY-YIG nuclease family protein n=1 Tax=Streptomyces sp. NPDC012616 TaxID=3364840 RepID=UPI0036EC3E5B
MSYTQLPVALIFDNRLSLRAKGLAGEIASYAEEPESSMPSLTHCGPDGRDAVLRALAELERFGYLERQQYRGPNGQLNGMIYRLSWGPVILQGMSATELSTTGWAYAMRADGSSAVKIGCSANPTERLRGVQTSQPTHVRIIWKAKGGRALESHLHGVFGPYRIRGEWFDFAGRDTVALISNAADEWAGGRR